MKKRKKKMKNVKENNINENELTKKIEKIAEGLIYISETDAEISAFIGEKTETVTVKEVLKQIGDTTDPPVEERDFNEFFSRLTKLQDWFGSEEIFIAEKFAELKTLLEENLKDLKVFKIGKIKLDIYVVGLDNENNLTGIKTKAVET